MKRRWLWIIGATVVVWIAYVALVYSRMNAAPGDFNQFMAGVPMPAMMLVPFETLWFRARAGVLEPGQMAPDFELPMHHGDGKLRLSASRGARPVLLIFGSYT